MNHLEVTLAARAFRAGRALRGATRRHRHLEPSPLAIVAWQLAGEPFSAAALGYGCRRDDRHLTVAGEPRNRDLLFTALLPFARWFNGNFEAPAARRERLGRGDFTFERALTAPQVVVANGASAELLGRLGRRLAYLPTTGDRPADPALGRLGRHLRFLWAHRAVPGQQLLVCLTDLLNAHWVTPMSPVERQSLAALDAWIAPPPGEHGFVAAARAEDDPAGPVPPGEVDERLHPLVERFNKARAGSTDPAVVGPLLTPLQAHYRPLVGRAWDLLWRCRDREAAQPEAASVGRRWAEDRDAYTRHIDWQAKGGHRRTRQTAPQAALTLRHLEKAGKLLEAEEATDDPLQMVPHLLANKAVRGRVAALDANYREPGPKRMVVRPLVKLLSADPCLMPAGTELWWSERPGGREFEVQAVEQTPDGWLVTLKLMTGSGATGLPEVGGTACFSVHNTHEGYQGPLPHADPWTHQPPNPAATLSPIEDEVTSE